jgi:hypothetical protein
METVQRARFKEMETPKVGAIRDAGPQRIVAVVGTLQDESAVRDSKFDYEAAGDGRD